MSERDPQPRPSSRETLTSAQRRILAIVQRMQDGPDECGHDGEGDLSICTGNLTYTLRTLRRRGLLERYDVMSPGDYYTDVKITERGREVLSRAF